MKKIILIGILVLKGIVFASNQDISFNELKQNLKIEQQIIFNEIFDLNEKLVDSYRMDLKYLNSSDLAYNEKVRFLESKIKELENDRVSEIEKLKNDFIKNPQRYNINVGGIAPSI